MTGARRLSLLLLLLLALAGGTWANEEGRRDPGPTPDPSPPATKPLVIALVPEQNVSEQRRHYRFLARYLQEKLGLPVELELMTSYCSICKAVAEGTADAGFFGSFSYVLAQTKTAIEPLARPVDLNDSASYRCFIFARRDRGIEKVPDMQGRRLVLVDRATTAGYIYPLYYFRNQGVVRLEDFFGRVDFAGTHDAAAWAVFIGEADVGACKSQVYQALAREYPAFAQEMSVLAASPEVPSNTFAVRKDVNPVLKMRLRDLLLGMHDSAAGREALAGFGAKRFIPTLHEDYRPLFLMIDALGIDLGTFPSED
ncbi:MAG: phosphate/phosphite/phosphonate ABC transporter substrate-binding protein [Thermodesulfobacteriota bacterium]